MILKNRQYTKILFLLVLVISTFGLFMVLDASRVWAKYLYQDSWYFFKRQLVFFVLGWLLFLAGYKLKAELIFKYIDIVLIISLVLLGLVLIPGLGQMKNGSRSWFGIGAFGFQPSEIFKITYLVYSAKFLYLNYQKSVKLKALLPLFLVGGLGFVLTMLEPDFGTALVTVMGLSMQVFLTKLKARYFVGLGFIALAGITVLIIAEPYRFLRITAFLDPYKDPLGAGFQIIQSLYALGPSGLSGLGINNSMQKHFYLPEPQTDFIFAIIVEEFGLIGAFILLLAYGLLFYYSYKQALISSSVFSCYLKTGLINVILIQTLINLGVVVGILPVTGITLPLVSYGGTSLVTTLFSLGIIVSKGDINEVNIIRREQRGTSFSRLSGFGLFPRFRKRNRANKHRQEGE